MKYDFSKVTGVKDMPVLAFHVGGDMMVSAMEILLRDTPLETIGNLEERAPAFKDKVQAVGYFADGRLVKQWHTGDNDTWQDA